MSESVLCKDCKHSFRTISSIGLHGFKSEHAYYCRKSYKEKHTEPNPVIGSRLVEAKYDSCSIARIGSKGRDHGRCGEEGLWWEPSNKKDLFKYIKHISV
jgi:hypothetical protein